jgi:hypothetical protein
MAAEPIVLEAPSGLSTLAITAAPGGGFALVAQELTPYSGGTDPKVHVFRYEANGRLRWKRLIDRRGPQIARAITYGPGEVLYVVGLDGSALTENGYQSMFVAIGPQGNVLEDKTFGQPAPAEDFLSGIGLTAGGDLIAAGRIKRTAEGTADMEVMRLTPTGDTLWTSPSVRNGSKESYPLVASGQAGTYIGGTFENRRVFVSRVDPSTGDLQNFAGFSTNRRSAIAQMSVLQDGGVLLAVNLSHGDNEAHLVRVSGGGSVMWDRKLSGNANIADFTRMPNGLIVVAGTSDNKETLTANAWLRAYDETGEFVGEILPDTTGETRAGGVTVDGPSGVFFAYSPIDDSIPARPVPVIVERIRVE